LQKIEIKIFFQGIYHGHYLHKILVVSDGVKNFETLTFMLLIACTIFYVSEFLLGKLLLRLFIDCAVFKISVYIGYKSKKRKDLYVPIFHLSFLFLPTSLKFIINVMFVMLISMYEFYIQDSVEYLNH